MNTLPVHREACFTFTPFPFVPKVSIFVFIPCIDYFYISDEKETQGRCVSTLIALWPFKSHIALWPAHLSCGLGCFSLWEVQLQGVGFGSGWRQANGNYRFLKKKRAVSSSGKLLGLLSIWSVHRPMAARRRQCQEGFMNPISGGSRVANTWVFFMLGLWKENRSKPV